MPRPSSALGTSVCMIVSTPFARLYSENAIWPSASSSKRCCALLSRTLLAMSQSLHNHVLLKSALSKNLQGSVHGKSHALSRFALAFVHCALDARGSRPALRHQAHQVERGRQSQ